MALYEEMNLWKDYSFMIIDKTVSKKERVKIIDKNGSIKYMYD